MLSGALSKLSSEVARLVRAELRLAQIEFRQKATDAGQDAALVAAGGALAFAGFFTLVDAATNLLALVVPRWLASLVVGSTLVGGGAILGWRGLQALKRQDLMPRQTVETLEEGIDLAKARLG